MTIASHDLELDHKPLNFGKYKGLSPDEISETDPDYIIWMYTNVKPPPCSAYLYGVCREQSYEKGDDDEGELW